MDGHKTTNLQGGRLSTTLDQVFADLDYSTLNLDAVNPDDKGEVTSNPQIVTGVGNVIVPWPKALLSSGALSHLTTPHTALRWPAMQSTSL